MVLFSGRVEKKIEVRLKEFIKRKCMYMETKNQAHNVTCTDVGGPE